MVQTFLICGTRTVEAEETLGFNVFLQQDCVCEDRPTRGTLGVYVWGRARPCVHTPPLNPQLWKPSVGELGVQGPAPRASITLVV